MRRAATIGSVGAGGLLGLRLATMASVSAQAASSEDFKALVCYNMLGGNDHLDTLYPYDPDNYNALRAIRGNQARDRATLLPITTATSQNGKLRRCTPHSSSCVSGTTRGRSRSSRMWARCGGPIRAPN